VIEYYAQKGIVRNVEAAKAADVVTDEIRKAVA
jgi:adenylate kinase family enzyme